MPERPDPPPRVREAARRPAVGGSSGRGFTGEPAGPLKDARLVADRREGARRVYYIDPDGLGELRRWLDQFWDDALEAFKKEVEKPKKPG